MSRLIFTWLVFLPLSLVSATTIVKGPFISNPIVLPAPIVWLKFSEGSGTNIADSSVNGNNFWLSGATWVTGENGSGNALQFSGTTQWAQSSANIAFGVKIITVCGWVWWDAFANDSHLLTELTANFNSNNGSFIVNPNSSTGEFSVSINDNGVRSERITRPSAAAWHHYAFVIDNSTTVGEIKIYLDGVDQATTLTDGKFQSLDIKTEKIYLFCRGGTTLFAAGRIDDFRIYGRELSPLEIGTVIADPQ